MFWKKTPVEERLAAVKSCTEGKLSQAEAARRLGVDESTVREWVVQYKEKGIVALAEGSQHVYSREKKIQVVKEYLSGSSSLAVVAAKYGLRSKTQKKYRSDVDMRYIHKLPMPIRAYCG